MHYSFCEWPPNIILNYNLPGKEIDTFQVSSCMSKSKLGAYTSALILIGMFMSFLAVSQGGPCAKSGQAKARMPGRLLWPCNTEHITSCYN